MISPAPEHGSSSASPRPKFLVVKVLRQDGPGKPSYWERFKLDYEPELNVISVLQKIATLSRNAAGKDVTPVAWDCNCLEEVCGACTMVVNGRVRQACSALVDKLLEQSVDELELRPMTKFPVVRDLMVDRGRMFETLKKVHAWIDVDGYFDAGAGPRVGPEDQERNYPLSQCMTCGCCVEACPQYAKIELPREEGETDEAYKARQKAAYQQGFIGPAAISQAVLFNRHPTGKLNASVRLDALMAQGGIQACGNAQNCVAVCPKNIPLTTSIAQAGRDTTLHALWSFFDK